MSTGSRLTTRSAAVDLFKLRWGTPLIDCTLESRAVAPVWKVDMGSCCGKSSGAHGPRKHGGGHAPHMHFPEPPRKHGGAHAPDMHVAGAAHTAGADHGAFGHHHGGHHHHHHHDAGGFGHHAGGGGFAGGGAAMSAMSTGGGAF
ncbi:hypothetical protein R1sor_003530 [Riccia sorocarpa]|uniref:Uncharacterized protein n=1 Tax=Riccia sorocarpa TaxID=122646 RepID=A0ABD3H2N7_9MARC